MPKMTKPNAKTAAKPSVVKSPRPTPKMKLAAIDEMFARLSSANPNPKTELNYSDPYTLLVAVVLSAQATDKGVNKATKGLFAAASTPKAMIALGVDGIKHHIKTIGLFNAKAENVFALSEQLINEHGGHVPQTREALEALPGVGRKTANVVLNIAFGEDTCAVDTHIFRVGNRTGLAPGANPLAVEKELMRRIPKPYRHDAHHWLILHGRYVCKARTPDCPSCSIRDLCRYREKTSA